MLRHHAGWGTCRGLPGAAHKTPGTGEVPTHRQRFNTRAGKGPSSSSHLCHRGDGGHAAELGWAPQIAVTLCWGVSTGTGAGSGYNKGVCRQVPVQDVGAMSPCMRGPAAPGAHVVPCGARCPLSSAVSARWPVPGTGTRWQLSVAGAIASTNAWCCARFPCQCPFPCAHCLQLVPVPGASPRCWCQYPVPGAGTWSPVPFAWCWPLILVPVLVPVPDPCL